MLGFGSVEGRRRGVNRLFRGVNMLLEVLIVFNRVLIGYLKYVNRLFLTCRGVAGEGDGGGT